MNEQLTQIYGYLHGMWRYRWAALLITWVMALAGWLYVISMPDQYRARAVVHVDTTSIMKPLLKGLALETDTSSELMIMSRVLLSRENLFAVMRETDMDLEAGTPQEREKMVEELSRSIVIEGGRERRKRSDTRGNIYEISYESASPELVFQVVSKLLNTMIEGVLNSSRTDTIAAQKFLDIQIAEYEKRLTLAELQLAEFKKANVGYMPDERGGYYARLQRAQSAVEGTRSKLHLAERRYVELSKQLKGEKPLLDEGKLRQYQEQLGVLLNQFTEEHPDVQAARAAIADLKRVNKRDDNGNASAISGSDIADLNPVYQAMKVDLNKAGVEIETLKIQLFEQKSQVKKLQGSIDVIPEVEARLSKLNRDYEVTRKRHLSLVERRESAKLAQSAGQSASDITFRVIEPPVVPVQPSGPDRLLLMTSVFIAALGAGLGWSFLNYLLQPTYIGFQQVRLATGLPFLGSVSLYLSPEHMKQRQMQLASFLSATFFLFCVYGSTVYFSVLA